jgi:hypothetical protein
MKSITGLNEFVDDMTAQNQILLPLRNIYIPTEHEETDDAYSSFTGKILERFLITWDSELVQIDLSDFQERFICDHLSTLMKATWAVLNLDKKSEPCGRESWHLLPIVQSSDKVGEKEWDICNKEQHGTDTTNKVTTQKFPPSYKFIGDSMTRTASLVNVPIEHMEEPSFEERSRMTEQQHVENQKSSLITAMNSGTGGTYKLNVVPFPGKSRFHIL